MSLLLLFGGATTDAPVVTGVDTGLKLSLPTLMVRGPVYVVPFLATEDNEQIQDESGAGLFLFDQLTLMEIALPALKVRRNNMANWWEAQWSLPSFGSMAIGITVTNVGLVSPTVSTSRAYDITDKDNITDVSGAVLSGSASISTSTWTTPIIQPAAADKMYRIETDVSDSGNTVPMVVFVNVPY